MATPRPKTTVAPPPEPSALTTLISSTSASNPLSANTMQVLHNLQHQHLWTSLQIHELQSRSIEQDQQAMPSFLISGIPPHRVYTHPDEQLFMLERGLRDEDIAPERTFVLPTAQGQSWSLRKLTAVFDSLPDAVAGGLGDGEKASDDGKAAKLAEYYERREKARLTKEWGSKRLLLAMVDKGMGGEGTVVYYIVQEGEVKPRQN